jgi:hypothetical protein
MLDLKLLEKQQKDKPKSSRNNKNKGPNQWNRDHKKTYNESIKQKAGSLKR